MLRLLLFGLGAAIALFVGLYFWTGRRRYLELAGRTFLAGLACGVLFFVVLLAKRLI